MYIMKKIDYSKSRTSLLSLFPCDDDTVHFILKEIIIDLYSRFLFDFCYDLCVLNCLPIIR